MNNLKNRVLLLLLISFTALNAQNSASKKSKLSLNDGTIDNQFEYVIQRSNSYQEFKVVKKTWLYALKAHTIDSLNALHTKLTKTEAIISDQNTEISNLKESLDTTKNNLEKTTTEKNNMLLFGMQMSKANYKLLMWSIIGLLLVLVLLFIYKFKNSNTMTREAKNNLSDTEEAFEEHRRTALEREQKVRRQLQDEINKQKGS